MSTENVPMEAEGLVEVYRDALLEAGYGVDLLAPRSGQRRLTSGREAFEAFAELRVAPEVVALIHVFADRAGLRERRDFSVSCLPSSSLRAPRLRVTAVKLAWTEVFVVEADQSTGAVTRVRIWAESDEKLGWLSELPETGVWDSTLDGGGIELVLPGESALNLMAEPRVARVVARRVASMRERRRRFCRKDWHNRWLWDLVESGGAALPISVPVKDVEWDVSKEDALRLVRRRRSQQAFRQRLLSHSPNECTICGIDVVDVLEAAHLESHASGGLASSENGRLLCANHHRAFDVGLYRWTGMEFVWVGPGPEPALGRG